MSALTKHYPDRIQLPFLFDVKKMEIELQQLLAHDWINHFVQENYEGKWNVLPLRGPAGAQHPILMASANPSVKEYESTPFLKSSPYFQEVLATFKCELEAVRLMKLSVGSRIKTHTDLGLSIEEGTVRIHIPVQTNPQVIFKVNGKPVQMKAGECWYLKLSDSHSVENLGMTDRVHLVLDMKVNPWLKKQLLELSYEHIS